jgi:PAS domain S-box-containing protein
MVEAGDGEEDEPELQLLARDELEQRVQRRSTELEEVLDTMADVLLKLDAEGRVRLANPAARDILGYEPSELLGRPIDHLLADDDETEMPTEGHLLDALVQEGRVTDVEVAMVTSDGETIATSLSASLIRDEDGAVDGVVLNAKDISERKAAEDRATFLHSLLRHDLGNKLQVTEGYLEMIDPDAVPEETAEHVEHALAGVREADDLVETVRALHRLDDEETLEPTSLRSTVQESVDRHADLADRVGVDVETDVPDVTVLAGSLLKELFSNLVENALVHSGGSQVRVDGAVEGDRVRVTVADDGEGVPERIRDDIFERGVKASGSGGSGLGMYLARRIARTYGGDIGVAGSDLGGGAFHVELGLA